MPKPLPITAISNALEVERVNNQRPTCTSPSLSLLQAYDSPYRGPQLHFHPERLEQQLGQFKRLLPDVHPHFAVKANPAIPLLKQLQRLGVDFEIASEGERELLRDLNVEPHKIVYSNPIKSAESIQRAYQQGVRWFAFDSQEELEKLHRYAPNGHYELRIALPKPAVDEDAALWPLREKFGLPSSDVPTLLDYAAKHALPVQGVTFHVGSQCLQASAWQMAIAQSKAVIKEMRQRGLSPTLLNIGGGLPINYSAAGRSSKNNGYQQQLEAIAKTIRTELATLPKHIEVIAEPGRFLAAPACELICQVISTTCRQGQYWCYLDCGFYNGLMELSVDFGYQLISLRAGPSRQWVVAGPTCDSVDTFTPRYQLPLDTQAGDLISIPNTGAYVYGCANRFNGFPTPTFIGLARPNEPHQASCGIQAYT